MAASEDRGHHKRRFERPNLVNDKEKLAAAESKMNAAKDALLKYTERLATIDQDEYQRLVARVKRAESEFLQALSEAGR